MRSIIGYRNERACLGQNRARQDFMPIQDTPAQSQGHPEGQEFNIPIRRNAGSLANTPDLCLPSARLTMVAAR
jgi:hypothetical protein